MEPIDLSEYIPLAEAARRIPSRTPGKRISSATVWRWVLKGKLPAVRIGRNYFVRAADLVQLVVPVDSKPLDFPSARQRAKTEKWVDEVLRKHKIK